MAFYGTKFIFDNLPSDYFNLILANYDKTFKKNSSAGSELKISTQSITGNPRQFVYGVDSYEPLEFELTIVSIDSVPREKVAGIENWLFGHVQYKKLQIIQDDMYGLYFNCRLTNPQVITLGNVVHGWKCKVVCDAPWAWQDNVGVYFPKIEGEKTFLHHNVSQANENVQPIITFTVEEPCDFTITTDKYPNRIFELKNLVAGDMITIDGQREKIYSDSGMQLLDNWNRKWFKIVPASNNITVTGNIKDFKMNYQIARKVGS